MVMVQESAACPVHRGPDNRVDTAILGVGMMMDGTCRDCKWWEGWYEDTTPADCFFMPRRVRKGAFDKCGQFVHRGEVW